MSMLLRMIILQNKQAHAHKHILSHIYKFTHKGYMCTADTKVSRYTRFDNEISKNESIKNAKQWKKKHLLHPPDYEIVY